MYHLLGTKEKFAIELELKDYWLNRTAVWVHNKRIGDWDDENLLAPFIISFHRISVCFFQFELDGGFEISCQDAYFAVRGELRSNNKLLKLSSNNKKKSNQNLDGLHLEWGENFDSFGLRMIYKNGICRFVWRQNEVNDEFLCESVALEDVQKVYYEFERIIGDDKWPKTVPRSL